MHEFDFKTLLATYRKKWFWFPINILISCFIAIFLALSMPKTYTSTVRLVAETQKENALSGSMGALASMAGVNLPNSEDAISPDLYPDVVSGNQFLIELLGTPVQTKKGVPYTSYLEYTQKEGKMAWWTSALKATIKGLVSLIKPQDAAGLKVNTRINPAQLTLKEEEIVKQMRKSIVCSIDNKTGVISLKATTQDPLVSKMLVDEARAKLQAFIIDYRTTKVRFDLQYYKSLEKQLNEKYVKAKQKYASYADAHLDVSLKSYTTVESDLENEMQLAFNAYTQMKQQVMTAEGKVQEKTPAFTTVESSQVANKASSPRTLLMLAAFVFLSTMGTALWFYFRLLTNKV
ncbi:MAG: chain-length determining protein [Bacteroidaceae bacterium]|nr:chain-length determining protein [Bacteroidaceae bacterium]